MRVFTRVYERRSFSQAAEDLSLPRSTVTDVIKQIEKHLSVRLLERTTRQVTPTLDGEAYYQRCLSLLADFEDMENYFSGLQPKGSLRVDVHGTLGRHFVLPRLPEFLTAYPDIQLYLSEGDKLVDLISEGIDCVLRVGTPKSEYLVAKQIAQLEEITVAAPGYLAQFGNPENVEELVYHQTVAFQSSSVNEPLPMEFTVGRKVVSKTLKSSMKVNSAETLVAACRLGLGIIQVPRYHIEQDLVEGRLVTLLDEYPPPSSPVHILYPPHRSHSARVRIFTEWLQNVFKSAIKI
ncbi:LysR family transcriptional regulator [Shewanella ulleungensis]|uniref:LysR family transcriptional regulator n=1 Tax=Shewanella ulleungensis TaxID=2282699 RepID=A0ABQ2QCA0_9GAMM|nr:LysR family transcriptional regulator [Shewanella ulleungensis]MCL1148871.1 LysR family transcriptional regulator [Shewanella ulleungensis]GGP75093.1 LysR family transcriptional regulator [Shewanella ulleungensis]